MSERPDFPKEMMQQLREEHPVAVREIERLRKLVEQLRTTRNEELAECQDDLKLEIDKHSITQADNDRLREQLAASEVKAKIAIDAFESYGHHTESCVYRAYEECTCGYEQAWQDLFEKGNVGE